MPGHTSARGSGEQRIYPAQLDAVLTALAHPVRRYLLELLRHDGAAATDLGASAAEAFGISRSRASQHLQVLARAGLVEVHADATWRHYRFAPSSADVVVAWLDRLGKP